MASAKWSRVALDNLAKLDPFVQERMLMKVNWLEENFSAIVSAALRNELKGLYKLRVGDYRIVYSIARGEPIIEAVGHRRDVYK
ncbi:MAG: type II toxin-antitoxin system RelE/ParE family toxin [Patescibacteria group bacterium]